MLRPHLLLIARRLGRLGAGVLLVLALAPGGARAQAPVAAKPLLPASGLIYLDGAATTSAALAQLDPQRIARTTTLRGIAARFFTRGRASSAVVITTQANSQSAAALALDQQVQQATDAVVKMEEGDLPLPAQAYLTHEYADYQLLDVDKVAPTAGEPLRYQATVLLGEQRDYLLFDAAGHFLDKL